MAELDALMALAYAAQFGADGAPMCRPTFVEPKSPVPGGPSGHVSPLLSVYACNTIMLFARRAYSVRAATSTLDAHLPVCSVCAAVWPV